MRKLLIGLVASLWAGASFAQSVLNFDVVFDRIYEASGAFTPNLSLVQSGPFCSPPACTLPPITLTGHVTLTAIASSTNLSGTNTITLNGSFSTNSGFSPASGWSTHTFSNAVFDLRGSSTDSYFATNFVTAVPSTDWPIFGATASNGKISDQGPASIYGGTCPFFFNCLSAQSGGSPNGTQVSDLFDLGTPVFAAGAPVFAAGFRDTSNHPLISGSVSQTNPSTGLGFEDPDQGGPKIAGMDAFAFQGVLDTVNTQGNGTSQLYPNGVNGYPGIVRIVTFSNTGNTAYVVEGKVTYVPAPAAVWLLGSGVGLLVARRQLRARAKSA